MLEHMSPWEYTRWIRPVLGHGSGFDSPGFSGIRRVSPRLGEASTGCAAPRACRVVELYQRGREFEELYQLAELLDRVGRARDASGACGTSRSSRGSSADEVVGTQGTPVELLGRLIHRRIYPELWQARNELTTLAKKEE